MGFPHGVHHPPIIGIESGLDGCVPHEFLLDRTERAIVSQPRPMGTVMRMPADGS